MTMLKFLVFTLVLAASVTASAPTKNIVQLAESVPDLSTLVAALKAGKLVSALETMGPLTVFAPTTEAFAKLPAPTLKYLLDPANIAKLRDVLEFHVISGAAVYSKDLKAEQSVKTLHGANVEITKDGRGVNVGVYSNTYSHVTAADNAATNGVVHIIDTVLIPFALPNRTHYGDPYTTGCLLGEISLISIYQKTHQFCAPVVSSLKGPCPTDVPSGVTAKPRVAFTGDVGSKVYYCALGCAIGKRECGPALCRQYSPTVSEGFCDYSNTSHTLLRGPPVLTAKTFSGGAAKMHLLPLPGRV